MNCEQLLVSKREAGPTRSRISLKTGCSSTPIKLALISCGLGRVQRGFEITTSRWQAAISSDKRLDLKVFSGGAFPDAERVWNIPRNSLLDSPLGVFNILNEKRFWELCNRVEQASFGIGLFPRLLSWKPDVIWTKELPLGRLLLAIRKMFGLKYKIIFAQGGGLEPASYKDFDLIQHLYPDSYREAARFGIGEHKMLLLPNCVSYETPPESREQLRRNFGFRDNDWIVICVAAWNRYQKRLDYLIEEVAALGDPDAKLLLCGHPEAETRSLKALAAQKLGKNVRWFTLAPEDVHRALYLSDVFVLPSLSEGLSSALIEAVMAGLPVICHPHPGGEYVLEGGESFVDLGRSGALSNQLRICRGELRSEENLKRLQNRAFQRFGAEGLAEEFFTMVKTAHAMNEVGH
jgi:glycosyltransferase involved in cell wall biosynthesis